MVRVRFCGCVPRKSYLQCAVGLPKRLRHRRFAQVEEYYPRFVGHRFHVRTMAELDDWVQRLIRTSYNTVGLQRHLA
jgi:hypothetical protein